MARPRKEIDPDEVRKLARLGATQREIAQWFGVHLHTIEARMRDEDFRLAWEEGGAELNLSLRRQQVRVAEEEKTSSSKVTMLIWLGKQRLGQTDKLEHSGGLVIEQLHERVREYQKRRAG